MSFCDDVAALLSAADLVVSRAGVAGTEGKMMGPPAESEYAVEPVGVR